MNKTQKELSESILRHRDLYYNFPDEVEISDEEFDTLVDNLTKIDPKDPAITMVGAKVRPSEWKKVAHRIPMGSLNKVNLPHEMGAWIDKSIDDAADLCWTEKLDGISIECVYDDQGNLIHALTRGAGEGDGEDILSNVSRMGGIKKKLSFSGSLRGEILLHRDKHEEFFPEKANPRNAAAGVSRRLDGDGSEHLDVYFYQAIGDDGSGEESDFGQLNWIKSLGLNTPNYGIVKGSNSEKLAKLTELWNTYQEKTRDSLNFEIDGLVVGVDNIEEQEALGETDNRPKGKTAWKFANQMVETTIIGITWTTKKSGRISPIVQVEPTLILGSVVSNASLYNYDYIEKLGLGLYTKCLISKRNEIIPRIEKIIIPPKEIFSLPTECPVCKGRVEKQDVYLMCMSGNCSGKKIGIINSWIKNLGVMEWGSALVEKLFDGGLVNDIADIYSLTIEDILGLDRMGETSARKAIAELWKVNKIPLHIFIGSIGILNVGRSTIEIAIDNGRDTLIKLFEATENDFASMKGIGSVKAKALYNGLRDNQDLINRILENGVEIMKEEKKVANTNGKLAGMRICITGKTDLKRDLWDAKITQEGGVLEKSVKEGTNFLVIVDTDSTTTKANAARKLGTKLITEAQLNEMVS